jgi:N-acetyl-gamma-glutamyl-phosphate reductase common form
MSARKSNSTTPTKARLGKLSSELSFSALSSVQTAVVGVSGYAGMELARLLLRHPSLAGSPPLFLGRPDIAPEPLAAVHPQFMDNNGTGFGPDALKIEPFSWNLLKARGVKVLFLATPHEQSREWVPQALDHGLRVIDLSGAWRLTDAVHRSVYKFSDEGSPVATAVQTQAVYGMPELHRDEIRDADLVANPGCYATSIILALKPLVSAGWIDLDRGIVCDSKSGVSGAGKAPTAKTHFMHAADNLSAYGLFSAIAELVSRRQPGRVVHGGGVQLTKTLAQMGKKSEFISGLRVTDAETRDAALMVLAGRVNKSLVAALGSHGQQAMGLSGGDGHVFRARKKKTNPDLGFVGEIAATDPALARRHLEDGRRPVISSIALGFDGEYYNINADEMAAACAIAPRPTRSSSSPTSPASKARTAGHALALAQTDSRARSAQMVVSGGMLPKLNACRDALTHGVKRVRILPAEARTSARSHQLRVNDGTEVMVA